VAGTKFYNESGHSEAFHGVRFGYLKESLRCPQANLSHDEAKQCKAELAPASAMPAGATLSATELITKYQCTNCHSLDTPNKILGPSLYDIGSRHNDAYIRESIVEPDKVVVAGFPAGVMKGTLSGVGFYKDIQQNPIMVDTLVKYLAGLQGGAATGGATPATATVVMPNFNLSDEELRNVVVFLLGVQESTVLWPQKSFATKTAGDGQWPSSGPQFAGKSGAELAKLAGCVTCHKLDGPERLVGPSLWDIGTRQSKESIRESILEPDKVITAGFPGGVMGATLTGLGFYQNVSVESLEKLVDYLASLQGK
jgi:cytochrome c551/c552